jgi:hypothetical protein
MRVTAVLLANLAVAACATLPQPPPVLGVPGKHLSFAATEGLPDVPTRATVSGPNTPPTVVERRFGVYEGGPAAFLTDPRLGFTHRLTDRLHWGGHLGWASSGLELRALPQGDLVETPVVVAVGAQLNAALMSLIGPSVGTIWDVRAQVSAHPTFSRIQFLVGAGLSAGRRIHELYIPEGPLGGAWEWFASYLRAARVEGRVEGIVGISVPVRLQRFALAAQPFYVAAKGAVSTLGCNGCNEQLHVDTLDAPWGVAFTLTWVASVP